MQIETDSYIITKSTSHEESWIFKVKKSNTFFLINASEEYIREAYE